MYVYDDDLLNGLFVGFIGCWSGAGIGRLRRYSISLSVLIRMRSLELAGGVRDRLRGSGLASCGLGMACCVEGLSFALFGAVLVSWLEQWEEKWVWRGQNRKWNDSAGTSK